MFFLSSWFLIFFLAVFGLYWTIGAGSAARQNAILLLAGLAFYAWIDPRFLALILCSAAINLALGTAIGKAVNDKVRRRWFWAGVILNIGLLGWFKYFGFFYDSFADLFNITGGHHGHLLLKFALPLGISYYTFQLTGYLIDVFHETIEPCRKPLDFFAYVLHFPKMLAGPVEPAKDFLPRVAVARVFSPAMASDGLRQVLWGIFAKVVIAENCAHLVDPVFRHIHGSSGSTLLVGAMLYLLQLYGDFSGYSNMAIGLSKLLGIPLMVNFRTPLFATDIGMFWRRWHISLTTWMMDYVFTPLSFLLRDKGKRGLAISIFITFLAVGFWHGANWTFVLFGVLQGLFFLPLVLKGHVLRSANTDGGALAAVKHFGAMAGMFLLMSLTFILMRAPNLHAAWLYWSGIASPSLLSMPDIELDTTPLLLLLFLLAEWRGKDRDHALATPLVRRSLLVRWAYPAFIIFIMGMYMSTNESAFIYFSF